MKLVISMGMAIVAIVFFSIVAIYKPFYAGRGHGGKLKKRSL